ncbi:hypothetical protein E2N92_05615 [Methanofollis formosanus]|uniref:Uncharacterized protein n=1 Tax=Methanofollis formosanus TaxID=299308 RepID=A0A8G1A1G8_9EURY|nr:hypothetical protein [Methanofollis formosanus]QYZ78938.1 hypothetical protein E2N92_05615 [Methanofollis formosanus]
MAGERTRMVGFRYSGKIPHTRGIQNGRPDKIDFQGIVRDANKKGKKIFKESRMMSLNLK